MTAAATLNAFTVDLEDYFHVSGFERHVDRRDWDSQPYRVVESAQRLLDLLARHQTRATFFVLGWVARKSPELIQRIHAAGHELGCHSFWHRLIYDLTPDEFRQDLRDAKAAIADATGVEVRCYRAPSFSITPKSLWALEILRDEGFTLDSSVFPTRHDRYGIPNARREVHDLPAGDGTIREYPATVVNFAGVPVPVGGGGYFRLYPWRMTRALLERVNREGRPFTFYVHPWEVDPQQPRFRFGSWSSRFRHYVNLAGTERKLEKLLATFRFGTISESSAAFSKRPEQQPASV